MTTVKMPVGKLVEGLGAAWKRKDGYIMGAKGQNPQKWATTSWWFTQYSGKQKTQALYWRENASRVWDCNGLSEGLYEDYTGVNINTKARYNYANWCDPKGTGSIPDKYKVPGAAVFIYSSSAGYITHVGYLYEPVNASNPTGDWYVIEARGVMYGVVRTKLSERGWNRWGWMTKYFDYGDAATGTTSTSSAAQLGKRNLKNGCKGEDVREMQEALICLGFDCGKWGADGDFGDATEAAVRAFQKTNGLKVDGIAGEKTFEKLRQLMENDDAPVNEATKQIVVTGGTVNIRDLPSTKGKIIKVSKKGQEYSATGDEENGWFGIYLDNKKGWISGKYAEVKE